MRSLFSFLFICEVKICYSLWKWSFSADGVRRTVCLPSSLYINVMWFGLRLVGSCCLGPPKNLDRCWDNLRGGPTVKHGRFCWTNTAKFHGHRDSPGTTSPSDTRRLPPPAHIRRLNCWDRLAIARESSASTPCHLDRLSYCWWSSRAPSALSQVARHCKEITN